MLLKKTVTSKLFNLYLNRKDKMIDLHKKQIDEIERSGLFDKEWYIQQCPYIKGIKTGPIQHYILCGWKLGYSPSPLFNGNEYLLASPGIINSNVNPLTHYLEKKLTKEQSIQKKQIQKNQVIKLCIATSGLKGPTASGGISKCTSNIIDLISKTNNEDIKKKVELTILYAGHPYYHTKDFTYWKQYFEKNYKYVTFDVIDTSEKTYGTTFMKRSYYIYKYLQKSKVQFDKILFHDFQGIGYYITLAKKSGLDFKNTQLIVNTHGNLRLSYFHGKKAISTHDELITMFMEMKSVENADFVVSPSKYYLGWWREYINLDEDKANVINNITYRDIKYTEIIQEKMCRPIWDNLSWPVRFCGA